ncbi:mannose-1-phosphate guanylyltransferase [Cohnella zeiphila]|uniref:mannose-1-phosphate guanylyltransferase n=1 Tax=Cohnella zeiphila TaxID=2761120 RepID=UPI00307FE251
MIMAGGKGTRFWPLSTEHAPKQFLSFHSEQTLIQETVSRFRDFVPDSRLFVAVPRRYLPVLREQLPGLAPKQLIVEPRQKDTAACIALAAFRFLQAGDNEPVAFIPADQYIDDKAAYLAAISAAAEIALRPNAIVTLGIKPRRPETGFGYLLTSPATEEEHAALGARRVNRFVEKPSEEKARELIGKDDVYWNSGIIVCRPETIARCIETYEPAIWNSLAENPQDIDAAYAGMPRLSIDYAVMERADSVYCLPIDCGWDDIGSWASMRRHLEPDSAGNVSKGNATLPESAGNIVFVEGKPAVVIGVKDLIIVSTANGLLVCPKSEEPSLKKWLSLNGDLT